MINKPCVICERCDMLHNGKCKGLVRFRFVLCPDYAKKRKKGRGRKPKGQEGRS